MGEHADELAREWARLGPFRSLDKLGLRYTKQGREAFICCPWHRENTPSCTVAIGKQGTLRVHCFACDETWDVHSLVSQVTSLDARSEFQSLLLHEAGLLGRFDIVDELEGKAERRESAAKPMPQPEPEPERTYPSDADLTLLLKQCGLTSLDRQVAAWLRERGLDSHDVDMRGLAYALPHTASLPAFSAFRGKSWIETGHRCIVPLYDCAGVVRSVRAGRIIENDTPKRLPPSGHACKSLVMADAMGQELLRDGAWPSWAPNCHAVVICEGEPDWMTWATRVPLRAEPEYATLGIFSGAWSAEIAGRIPDGSKVVLWTDSDAAGEKYATAIAETLAGRCAVLRGQVSST